MTEALTIYLIASVLATGGTLSWLLRQIRRPEPGQIYRLRHLRSRNPFAPPKLPLYVRVLAVRRGWVLYALQGGTSSCSVRVSDFQLCYERAAPPPGDRPPVHVSPQGVSYVDTGALVRSYAFREELEKSRRSITFTIPR